MTSAGETKHVDVSQESSRNNLPSSGHPAADTHVELHRPTVGTEINSVGTLPPEVAKPAPVVPPSAATGPNGPSGERFLPWEPVRYLLPSEGRSGAPVDLAGPRAVGPPHRLRDGSPPLREPLPEAAQDAAPRDRSAAHPRLASRVPVGPHPRRAGRPWGGVSPAACPEARVRPVHAPAARRAGGWAACPVSLRHGPAPEPRALRVRAAWSVAGPLLKSARGRLAPGFHAARSSAARARPALAQRVKDRGSAE